MLLYVIRHGQTDYNREERLQGARDIPLNETGRGQATGNGLALAKLTSLELPLDEFDWVASPLGRTRETGRKATPCWQSARTGFCPN